MSGMSIRYRVAVEEGAILIHVGTKIFGLRIPKPVEPVRDIGDLKEPQLSVLKDPK